MKRASGFTMLEVMGAVLILGLLGTSLMTATLESTRRAAGARDLLTASLLADSALTDLLAARRASGAPGFAPGRDEREDQGFRIAVETRPVDAAALGMAPLVERPRGEPPASVLAVARGGTPALLSVHVEVSGADGVLAERTTFVFDPRAVPELEELAPPPAEPGP